MASNVGRVQELVYSVFHLFLFWWYVLVDFSPPSIIYETMSNISVYIKKSLNFIEPRIQRANVWARVARISGWKSMKVHLTWLDRSFALTLMFLRTSNLLQDVRLRDSKCCLYFIASVEMRTSFGQLSPFTFLESDYEGRLGTQWNITLCYI